MYNTIIDTLQSGHDPQTPTQTYQMANVSNVTYGLQPAQPKSPAQTVSEINDECISTYMMNNVKLIATSFTTTALETTNSVLRRIFDDSIPNDIELGYEIYLYQNRNGYYDDELLEQQEMQMITSGFSPAPPNMTQ